RNAGDVGREDVGGLVSGAPAHGDRRRVGGAPSRPVDRAVTGDRHADVVPRGNERGGKRAGHVAQTADLYERRGLGGDEEDLHDPPPRAPPITRAVGWPLASEPERCDGTRAAG